MVLNQAVGSAIKQVREAKQLTQEDFFDVSSRTYISSLERGLKSPTLKKIDGLAKKMGVHPITLVLLAYSEMDSQQTPEMILESCIQEINTLFYSVEREDDLEQ